MDQNKLYNNLPEEQEWDVDQSLFDHTPVKQGEKSFDLPYNHRQENLSAENYDDLYNNSPNKRETKTRSVKKTNSTIVKASTILVFSVVGVVTVLNPLTMRPKTDRGLYTFSNGVFHYEFEAQNVSNAYDCQLVLLCNNEEIHREKIEKNQYVTCDYPVTQYGSYELRFDTTNNFDYYSSSSLYTFTY